MLTPFTGEHLATDEALAVADEQDFLEQRPDLVAQGADEVGEGGEVRGAVAGQGDEGDLFATGTLDLARTDEAQAVGEQDDLEQHGRRVGAGTGKVVLVAGIKAAEIESVIDQTIQGVFKGAGKQLPFEIDGDEARLVSMGL